MADTHVIVLPGGGYAMHAQNEAEPIVEWLSGLGVASSVFRYPLNVPHPVPLDAVRAEIRCRRTNGADGTVALRRRASSPSTKAAGQTPQTPLRTTTNRAYRRSRCGF